MKIFKWISWILLLQIPLVAGGVATLPEEQTQNQEAIRHVNEQIDSLVRLKSYYLAKVTRYRNRANSVRFQQGENSKEEADRLNRQADDYEKIVKNLNGEIAKLDKQKRALEKKA